MKPSKKRVIRPANSPAVPPTVTPIDTTTLTVSTSPTTATGNSDIDNAPVTLLSGDDQLKFLAGAKSDLQRKSSGIFGKITNFSIIDITPRIKDPEIQKLMPTTLKKYSVAFELVGVNVAIANGIRRVLVSELPAKAMTFDYSEFSTTDRYVLNDFVQKRIRNIPIMQSVTAATEFKLHVKNSTANNMVVKAADIRHVDGRTPTIFNTTFDLAVLQPNTEITINRIYIAEDLGYNDACHTLAFNVACVPLDVNMYNQYNTKPDQIHSGISDPRHHRITFNTNGTMDPKKIVSEACLNIIARLSSISAAQIESVADQHTLTIAGESSTIGNLLMKSIIELFPDIPACTFMVDQFSRKLQVKIRNAGAVDQYIAEAVKENIKVLTALNLSLTELKIV